MNDDYAAVLLERQLRHRAAKYGLRLKRNRTRNPAMPDYDLWALLDAETGNPVNPGLAGRYIHSWTLAQIKSYLDDNRENLPERKLVNIVIRHRMRETA